jgi:hypothetical protein
MLSVSSIENPLLPLSPERGGRMTATISLPRLNLFPEKEFMAFEYEPADWYAKPVN